MPDLAQAEWARWQVAASEARDRFLAAIAEHPELAALWVRWRDAEGQLLGVAGGLRRQENPHD